MFLHWELMEFICCKPWQLIIFSKHCSFSFYDLIFGFLPFTHEVFLYTVGLLTLVLVSLHRFTSIIPLLVWPCYLFSPLGDFLKILVLCCFVASCPFHPRWNFIIL